MAKEVGIEWVNTYDCLNQLTHEHEDAGGFYDELVNHDGWVGSFNWGNGAAWEQDFKRPDKGGTANLWVDTAAFVYFTGHGSPWGFYFRCDVPDDNLIECDHYTGPTNGDLRLGNDDLEWLALEVCNTLQLDAILNGTNLDVFDRWAESFQGMHTICSFTTVSLDLATPGRYFAVYLDGRWPLVLFGIPEWMIGRFPLKVIDAWFAMTSLVQPAPYEAAVLYDNTQGTDTQNDYIWDHGHVSTDPRR
ncbi:MAG TPA: DUF6345 domain-containing protein, partial [Pseudodesulfovibrio sp.]|nr:DUF6345 domain-containing protein [Pseudodesulfovibrio sp.]